MMQRIASVTLLVKDYDEAVEYYTNTLGFVVVEDTLIDAGKRWVIVAPRGSEEAGLLLAKATSDQQRRFVGSQTGGRVFLFLHTDDFHRDYAAYSKAGVAFMEEPRTEAYGTVAVFSDLYGNHWDLMQPNASGQPSVQSGT